MRSVSPPSDVEEFLSLILKSRLLNWQEVNAACTDFLTQSSTSGCEPTFDSLCKSFVSTNRLTQWQCDRLKEGRWKGFFLDQFKLIDLLEVDDDFSYYLAEDVAEKRCVKLQIAPKSRYPHDSKIHYEVLEL